MTSGEIKELLAARHTDDVFVPECKNGPTWGSTTLRLDAWAMRKSWANPCTWGYEIKVDRSDWLNDKKWQLYTSCVNCFVLVSPPKVIQIEEVPPGIGLLYAASTGNMLVTKRKAHYNPVDPAVEALLLQYVLQSRATIDAKREPGTVEEWQKWLAQKDENKKLGWMCSQQLQAKYKRDVEEVRNRQEALERLVERAAAVVGACKKLGIDFDAAFGRYYWSTEEGAERAAREIKARLVRELLGDVDLRKIREASRALTALLADVKPDVPRTDTIRERQR